MDDASLKATLGRGADCPPIEELSAQLESPEGSPTRAAAERHLLECMHCRTEMDLLKEFEAGTIRPEEEAAVAWISSRLKASQPASAPVRKAGWFGAWSMPKLALGLGGVAAVALVAIGISNEWQLRNRASNPLPEFGQETQRSRTIEILPVPGSFAWKPVSGASRYDLTARTVDGTVIFHNTFTTTTLAFPPEVAALVSTGKLLEWEVVAIDETGNEIAKSGVQRLRQPAAPTK